MSRTASELHGTGADISRHGTPGALHLGDTADGMIRGTTEVIGDGMTHGTTADGTADGMIRGITAAGMEAIGAGTTHGTIHTTVLTTADGTVAGTHTGDTTITVTDRDISEVRTITRMYGTAQGIRPVPTECSEAVHPSEEA